MKLLCLFEQAAFKSIALKLQQQLLDESDGLLDIELHPIEPEGIESIISSPFGKLIARVIPISSQDVRISVWVTNKFSDVKFFKVDDDGMHEAVKLIIRRTLGSTWPVGQRLNPEYFKTLITQSLGLKANDAWYKLKRRVIHPELAVGKLYLVAQKGTAYHCELVRYDAAAVKGENGRIIKFPAWTNILLTKPWKWPEMGVAMFYELERLS